MYVAYVCNCDVVISCRNDTSCLGARFCLTLMRTRGGVQMGGVSTAPPYGCLTLGQDTLLTQCEAAIAIKWRA